MKPPSSSDSPSGKKGRRHTLASDEAIEDGFECTLPLLGDDGPNVRPMRGLLHARVFLILFTITSTALRKGGILGPPVSLLPIPRPSIDVDVSWELRDHAGIGNATDLLSGMIRRGQMDGRRSEHAVRETSVAVQAEYVGALEPI